MLDLIVLVIFCIILFLVLSATLAPLESLSWWAGWFGGEDVRIDAALAEQTLLPGEELDDAHHYIVYLSGIGAIAGDSVPQEEYPFIDGLRDRLPGTKVISDVYPYAMNNTGLTNRRVMAGFWRWLEARRLKNMNDIVATIFINLRNAEQVFVSADSRYGPIYDLGTAREIRNGLLRHGYKLDSRKPVTLVGWSGGGQISVGAAEYLRDLIKGPLYLVSVGGLIANRPGLDNLDHIWHNYGTQDVVQALGGWIFPGRWPTAKYSYWNRALAAGRITLHPLGPYNHNVKQHYFDNVSTLESGQTYMGHLLDTIEAQLKEAGVVKTSQAAPNGTTSYSAP